MDDFAESGEVGLVGGQHAAVFFEGFEDGKGTGKVVKAPASREEVALEVGAVGFGRARRSRMARDLWK